MANKKFNHTKMSQDSLAETDQEIVHQEVFQILSLILKCHINLYQHQIHGFHNKHNKLEENLDSLQGQIKLLIQLIS